MTASWSWYIIILTALNIIGLVWLLLATARTRPDDLPANETMGHVWDGDITELNNPLPRWWFGLFVITVIFALIYLAAYPGLGTFKGGFGWTSDKEVQAELDATHAKLETLYASFRDRPLEALMDDPAAVKVGRNVFVNNCASCHGTDGRGARGYPNLVDGDWQYGGDPETVAASVQHGRHGMMVPLGAALGEEGTEETAQYVMKISGQSYDAGLAAAGQARFEGLCAACHGVEGKGNPLIGAPNLTDSIWLYGNSLQDIRDAIVKGRSGVMPAWEPIIGADRSRLAAVWVLAQARQNTAAEAADAARSTQTP
ncbi:MAG: cytochrome-c oxidase, cbb3-type subunit III [Dokdonella sp.]